MADKRPTVITAQGLAAGYENNVVWKDADFAIEKGEFVAVIGPNGAGKTTLFRLLLGLQQPYSGTLEILDAKPRKGNSRIGYVPQRHLVDSEMPLEALELVHLGISGNKWGFSLFSRADHQAAIEAMDAVDAAALAHRPLGVLSGGELQRVFLAAALVSNPEILLLDEPMSNLDLRREKELLQLVDRVVRSRNVTALVIAHNINPLLPFLDRVIYIANGKVATGKPKEVLTSERLSDLFGVHIEVLQDSRGNIAIIGVDDHHPDE